jgi:hypothetical protein
LPVTATGVSADRAFARSIEEGSVPKTDMAIYVDPTMLEVYVAQISLSFATSRWSANQRTSASAWVAPDGAPERFCSHHFCREYFTRVASIYLQVCGS